MATRFIICNKTAKKLTNIYYYMIVKENQQKEQILYKPLYKNLLSQTNKYITDIETLLSKIKGLRDQSGGLKDLSLLNSPILVKEQIKEYNIINQT